MARGIGNIVDEIYQVRAQRLRLEDEVSMLKERQTNLEQEFIARAQEQNLISAKGHTASSSVKEQVLPHVDDWDSLYRFIHANNYYHLLERRPSVGAFRELFDKGIEVPGVEPFIKYKVNTQKVGK